MKPARASSARQDYRTPERAGLDVLRVDYPPLGLEEPGWPLFGDYGGRYSACEIRYPDGHSMFCFFAGTWVDIDPRLIPIGAAELFLMGETPYLLDYHRGVTTFPSRMAGYPQVVRGPRHIALANDLELLIISDELQFYYEPELANDDLTIEWIDETRIGLKAWTWHKDEVERWCVTIEALTKWRREVQ